MTVELNIRVQFRARLSEFSLHVDLTLPGKGVSVLFGPSGCGKTTLLRCIAGLQLAVGELHLGKEVWQDASHFVPVHQRSLGYVFQEANLFPHLTVKGNLLYGYKRIPKIKRKITFANVVAWLGLSGLIERKPEYLSGGQRQRVAIARALLTSPQLLLMDEPLVSLDYRSKAEIFPYLERLRDELDIPIIYVTHSIDEMMRLANHIVIMEQGQILASGSLTDTLVRFDLPAGLFEDAGVVLTAKIIKCDAAWHLVCAKFPGGNLWVQDKGLVVGDQLRIRVMAKDVSLATQAGVSSIQNVLQGIVDAIGDDRYPGLALVRVRVGETMFLSRLTKRAVAALQLQPGLEVWVQVKAVALMR